MVKTMQEAKAKYTTKIRAAGDKYATDVGAFLGMDVSGSLPVQNYKQAVQAPDIADRWEKGYRSAFSVR
jgi:hypothetical protein